MKSLDMFSSADSRKKNKKIFLEQKNIPEGDALSPYIVSLWSNKNLPIKEIQKKHEKTLSQIEDLFKSKSIAKDSSTYKKEKDEKELKEIENLFKGSGKIPEQDVLENHNLKGMDANIPSVNKQLEAIKNSKIDYPDNFSPRIKKQGFFRNFSFWD
jgi:hypothetical protein